MWRKGSLLKLYTVMESTRKDAGRERRMWMFEIKIDLKTREKTYVEVKYVSLLRDKI
jgi:hypothetical protein